MANASSISNKVRLLMIAAESETGASQKTIHSLKAQLSDLDIDFQVAWIPTLEPDLHKQADITERLAEQYNASIVFWSDLLTGERIFLYVSEPGGGRILVRSVSFEDSERGDRFSVIALIVRTAVEAIVEGGHIGVTRGAPNGLGDSSLYSMPRPSKTPVTEPGKTATPDEASPASDAVKRQSDESAGPRRHSRKGRVDSSRLNLAAAYLLSVYSPTTRLAHGARLALAVRVNRWGRIHMAYRVQIPIDVESELAAMTLRHHPFELGFSARFEMGRLYLDIGAGIVNDPLTWKVSSVGAARIAPMADRFRWLVGASPFVRASWSPLSVFKLYLALAADIYFNESPSYVERVNGDEAIIVDPFTVRPHCQLGVIFFLF